MCAFSTSSCSFSYSSFLPTLVVFYHHRFYHHYYHYYHHVQPKTCSCATVFGEIHTWDRHSNQCIASRGLQLDDDLLENQQQAYALDDIEDVELDTSAAKKRKNGHEDGDNVSPLSFYFCLPFLVSLFPSSIR